MKFSKKKFVQIFKFRDLWALEKKRQFRHLFSLETLKLHLCRDSNPGPCASQSDPLSTIPSFLMINFSKFLRQVLKDFYNLCVAESPVGSSSNRRFRLKRQKTRNVNNFWPRWNFCMKFSNLYEEVQKLSDFARISHEAVVHPKSELHYCTISYRHFLKHQRFAVWSLLGSTWLAAAVREPTLLFLTEKGFKKFTYMFEPLQYTLGLIDKTKVENNLVCCLLNCNWNEPSNA